MADAERSAEQLTFVTVVFDAEVTLLEVQARSMARHLDPQSVAAILVLDNSVGGLSRSTVRRLEQLYGAHARKVAFVRTHELIDAAAATGWRSQQAAKLAVAQRVETPHYVTLDAKNHFTAPVDTARFVAADGRARGASHGYATHPLRPALERTLRYLGASDAAIEGAVDSFPPTATPFVLDTAAVRSMIADIEERSHNPFALEFERRELLEFFLYSGWLATRGSGIAGVMDGTSIPSPTVWPKAADVAGVEAAIAEAERDDAFVFAVHRQVFARADRAAIDRVARYWADRGIVDDEAEGRAFIRRFRRRYLPAIVRTRLAERLRGVRARQAA